MYFLHFSSFPANDPPFNPPCLDYKDDTFQYSHIVCSVHCHFCFYDSIMNYTNSGSLTICTGKIQILLMVKKKQNKMDITNGEKKIFSNDKIKKWIFLIVKMTRRSITGFNLNNNVIFCFTGSSEH